MFSFQDNMDLAVSIAELNRNINVFILNYGEKEVITNRELIHLPNIKFEKFDALYDYATNRVLEELKIIYNRYGYNFKATFKPNMHGYNKNLGNLQVIMSYTLKKIK